MSADASRYVIPPPPQAALAVAGSDKLFAVRRIWCVGRNYLEHIKEMGQDEASRVLLFQTRRCDRAGWRDRALPLAYQDLHHEVELVVALKGGGRYLKAASVAT
jgi:fumarylpyruvate hydrolase